MRWILWLMAAAAPAQAWWQAPEKPSQEKMAALAAAVTTEYEGRQRFFDNPEVTGYVNALAARLAGRPVQVRVIASSEVQRAAIQSGRLYVSTALLAAQPTEADLAAQLAHLVAHLQDPPVQRGPVVMGIADDDGPRPLSEAREQRAEEAVPGILRRAGYGDIVTTSQFQRMRELLPTAPTRKTPTLLR